MGVCVCGCGCVSHRRTVRSIVAWDRLGEADRDLQGGREAWKSLGTVMISLAFIPCIFCRLHK